MRVKGISSARASAAIEECRDLSEAAKLLESWALNNQELYNNLTQPFLRNACHEAVRNGGRDKREIAWGKSHGVNQQGERLRELSRNLLENFIIVLDGGGGIPISDATAEDILYAATRYKRQGDDMLHKYRWLARIAVNIGKKTVGEVFTNDDLARLKDESLDAVPAGSDAKPKEELPGPRLTSDGRAA